MQKFLLLSFTFLIQLVSFGQQEAVVAGGKKVLLWEDGTWAYKDSLPLYNIKPYPVYKLEIPKKISTEVVISHTGYSFSYNETHEQSNWVAYELTKEKTVKLYERTDKFLVDPLVKTSTANDKDYEGTGYDRGHLAPAADMAWSEKSMIESFYYSNISPQEPGFNRGIWKKLEELVRFWAVECNSVYVVTGPVLKEGLVTVGKNGVSLPDYFYKVILDYREPGIKGIGFIIPNSSSTAPLSTYAVTIDSVEKFTNIDFFYLLPDEHEIIIESELCIKCWNWKNFSNNPAKSTVNSESNSIQCNGNTQEGARCKNKTLNQSGYCYLHESQDPNHIDSNTNSEPSKNSNSSSVQCSGTTKAGSRCKNKTLSPNGKCHLHGGN